jgi:peptidylamidoglycolate lyase
MDPRNEEDSMKLGLRTARHLAVVAAILAWPILASNACNAAPPVLAPGTSAPGSGATASGTGAAGGAAVANQRGGQDHTGPYEVVPDWPKPLSQLPGHEKWTWGAVQGIFAESPDRVFVLMRGELPALTRPAEMPYPSVGPSLSFPVSQTPFRNASVGPVSSPGNSGSDGWNGWKGKMGVDARWEHCLVVLNAAGEIVEQWTQWDANYRRPHSVAINPYDPEKHVWVVDDRMHAVYKYSNDGKTLVQTLGVPGMSGTDERHFNRPTFLTWLPDSTLFVSDGYANTRVVKFDKEGKYLLAWGEKGMPPNDTRPGTFDAVHGVQVDPETRKVYVTDRSSHRIQVFDENGKYLDQFSTGAPSTPQVLYLSADKRFTIADNATSKILTYDLDGTFRYSWGSSGEWPGAMWNVHGMSVDQDGNFYIAEVNNGRAQKFRPRAGANPAWLVGQPVRAAW